MTRERWRIPITTAFLVILLLVGCGPRGGEGTLTATATSTALPAPQGSCGDGVCDGPENAQNCPQDCGDETPASPCGDGVCDEAEQANPSLCPQDCAQTGVSATEVPTPPATSVPSPGRARVRLEWRSSYGPCQVDDLYAEIEFTWSLTEDGALIGSGEGTMYAEPVSRCPDTEYGGVRTPDPYPVTVTSTVTASGWMVELVAADVTQAYFVGGAVYHEECMLCWVLPEYKGLGISGSLSSFSLPRELQVGNTFRFELDYHVPQASWTNDHVGTGTLEILEIPH